MATLSNLALRDIEAKLAEQNVTTETFSRFAAQYVLDRLVPSLTAP